MRWTGALALLLAAACTGREAAAPPAPTTTSTSTTTGATTTTRPTSSTAPPRRTTTTAAAVAGTYRFPVAAASARYGHSHHDYPATDIFAPCGSQVVAAAAGVVQEVSRSDTWDPKVNDGATRGGLFTSVIGDDGVRYYGSHLSAVAPGIDAGVRVSAGQPLGSVGDTGDARGVGCHLHFGLSPNCGPGDWAVRRGAVYPWPYLDSWRAGGQRSPAPAVAAWNAAHPC
ncbi:MAG TPA: peptidoglycan DD-metalloendopeptidase family protein [Acidimicrobiales bacterium]|nr:peptidoglycan DD-metalloendopeptidase family protein [Acidimicrobiales bacterium]